MPATEAHLERRLGRRLPECRVRELDAAVQHAFAQELQAVDGINAGEGETTEDVSRSTGGPAPPRTR